MTGTVECSGMDPNLAWSSRIGFPCVLSHRHGPIFPWIPNCRLLILLFDLYITFELQSVVFQHTSRATQLKTSNVLEMVSKPGQAICCRSSFAPPNHIFLTACHMLNFRQQTLLLSYWNIQMFVSGIRQLSSHVVGTNRHRHGQDTKRFSFIHSKVLGTPSPRVFRLSDPHGFPVIIHTKGYFLACSTFVPKASLSTDLPKASRHLSLTEPSCMYRILLSNPSSFHLFGPRESRR